jgi:hypothetical protein
MQATANAKPNAADFQALGWGSMRGISVHNSAERAGTLNTQAEPPALLNLGIFARRDDFLMRPCAATR